MSILYRLARAPGKFGDNVAKFANAQAAFSHRSKNRRCRERGTRGKRIRFFEPYGRFGIQHQAIDDIQCLLRPTRNDDLLADAIDVFARAQMRGDRFA